MQRKLLSGHQDQSRLQTTDVAKQGLTLTHNHSSNMKRLCANYLAKQQYEIFHGF
jgi:hypothetical protein